MREHTLIVYLPQDRRLALARGAALPERAEGAALFADISGFTPLTEALTQALGPRRGVEELTAQIDRVYDALIAEVERFGGSVVSFAGDAMMCWFDEAQSEKAQSADQAGSSGALRATAAALALQGAMGGFAALPMPLGGTVALGLKVAVASGQVRRFVVGDPAIQSLDALAGATVARTAAAEHLAGKGEVVLDGATIARLGARAQIGEWRDDGSGTLYGVLSSLLVAVPPVPPPPEEVLDESLAYAWLVPAVSERVRDGLGEFLTELRPAVALFLRFGGIDYDGDSDAGAKLDAYIRWVQSVLARYGGTLLQLTIGDKGSYLYGVFGAPLAHEDDARRAAAAALELRAPAPELGFLAPVQIGISQGMMRSGAYGGATRRTYGVLGDEVNLAARLMQLAAPGEVLASERVREKISAAFAWEPLPATLIKGKREPIPLARLLGAQLARTEPAAAGALVGRDTELAWLRAAVAPIFRGRFAGLAYVYGEPGMGKSRLVEELRRELDSAQAGERRRGASWLSLPADEILHQSLNPFRALLRSYLNQDPSAAAETNAARCDAALDALIGELRAGGGRRKAARVALAAELERTRAFLAALVDLRYAGSLYEQLEPKLRFENTLAALKALLLAESLRRPLVLHIEDAQWLDDDSLLALRELTRNTAAYPFVVLITSRSGDDGSSVRLSLDDAVPQQALELRALVADGVRAVAAGVLGGAVSDDLAAFLAAKTGGNPFFAEQLALDLRERELLEASRPADGGAPVFALRPVSADEVPETINAVLIARLDRLAARVKAVVQTAAVLGQEFEVRLLSSMLRDNPQLPDQLRQGERETIWMALNELRYLFRHALLRDAAYAMQLRARLRELHRLAAEAIERIHAADLLAHAADLTYHYGRAEDTPRERQYARMAGEHAAARYANADAAAFFSRALELTPAADGAARYALLLAREQIYDLQGARDTQYADLLALAALAEQLDDSARRIESALRQARHADVTGNYPAMIAAVQRAIDLAAATRNAEGEATGYLHWARALWYQGDYAGARARAEQALHLARAAHSPQPEADSLRIIGNAALYQGSYAEARAAYESALQIHRELGDRRGESATRNNLGIIAWYQGSYEQARAAYDFDLQTKRDIGDRYGQSLALLNLGEVACVQGDYPGAQGYYAEALRLKREIGDRYGESVVLTNLGDIAATLGDWQQARASYEAALVLTHLLGHQQQEGWTRARLGLLLHQQQGYAAALEQCQQSETLARAINDRNTLACALTVHGHALAALARAPEAAQIYYEALELRRALAQPNQASEPLAGLARLALATGDVARASEHVAEILAHLDRGTLEGADEPFRVYLTCCRVLRAAGDARSTSLHARARELLRERAARIEDEIAQHTFLEHVPSHRELLDQGGLAD